jgi:DNA processing protein
VDYKEININRASYPQVLKSLPKPPPRIFVSGNIKENDFDGIAVVGSRKMTSYGEAVIRSIVSDFVRAGITIVSGLAFGVDSCAQKCAIDLGGRTPAVLGSGVNNIHPRSNEFLAERIVKEDKGGLLSFYEPNDAAKPWNFPERDFFMAVLSRAILVIEATEKSGTKYTVDAALDLEKEVFVVPGSIFSNVSKGNHAYIRDGARLVTSAKEIFEDLKIPYEDVSSSLTLPENERKVYDLLEREGVSFDYLLRSIDLLPSESPISYY